MKAPLRSVRVSRKFFLSQLIKRVNFWTISLKEFGSKSAISFKVVSKTSRQLLTGYCFPEQKTAFGVVPFNLVGGKIGSIHHQNNPKFVRQYQQDSRLFFLISSSRHSSGD